MNRPLYEIASEIRRDWRHPSPHAEPYLAALSQLTSISENYYYDSGRSVVAYFLANAQSWRGEVAKRVKLELKQILKEYSNAHRS